MAKAFSAAYYRHKLEDYRRDVPLLEQRIAFLREHRPNDVVWISEVQNQLETLHGLIITTENHVRVAELAEQRKRGKQP